MMHVNWPARAVSLNTNKTGEHESLLASKIKLISAHQCSDIVIFLHTYTLVVGLTSLCSSSRQAFAYSCLLVLGIGIGMIVKRVHLTDSSCRQANSCLANSFGLVFLAPQSCRIWTKRRPVRRLSASGCLRQFNLHNWYTNWYLIGRFSRIFNWIQIQLSLTNQSKSSFIWE